MSHRSLGLQDSQVTHDFDATMIRVGYTADSQRRRHNYRFCQESGDPPAPSQKFDDLGSGNSDSDSETQVSARADADRADRGVYDPHGADHDGYT